MLKVLAFPDLLKILLWSSLKEQQKERSPEKKTDGIIEEWGDKIELL